MEKKRRKRCDACRGLFEESEMIYGPDPFLEEIEGDDTPTWLCKDCHYASAMEI